VNGSRISELATRSGVPTSTLRFYGSAGLLPAERTASGYRANDEQAVEGLNFIGAAKPLGLSLEEIAERLAVRQSAACRGVRVDLCPRIAARIAEGQSRSTELQAFTASQRRALQHLDSLPDRAGRSDPECGFAARPRPRYRSRCPCRPARWHRPSLLADPRGGLLAPVDQWNTNLDSIGRIYSCCQWRDVISTSSPPEGNSSYRYLAGKRAGQGHACTVGGSHMHKFCSAWPPVISIFEDIGECQVRYIYAWSTFMQVRGANLCSLLATERYAA